MFSFGKVICRIIVFAPLLLIRGVAAPFAPLASLFVNAFVQGVEQRKADDKLLEEWRPEATALVESGHADWCPDCEGAGVVFREREFSKARIEFFCGECKGLGVKHKEQAAE